MDDDDDDDDDDFYLIMIICLHTVTWFHVFLSNTNFQMDLFDPQVEPLYKQLLWVRVGMKVMQ